MILIFLTPTAFTNQGQVCLAGSRLFVERPIYDKFVEAVVAKVRGFTSGTSFLPALLYRFCFLLSVPATATATAAATAFCYRYCCYYYCCYRYRYRYRTDSECCCFSVAAILCVYC